MYATIVHAYQQQFDEQKLLALVGLLQQPVIQKMVALQQANALTEHEPEFRDFLLRIAQSPAPENRVALVRALVRSGSVEVWNPMATYLAEKGAQVTEKGILALEPNSNGLPEFARKYAGSIVGQPFKASPYFLFVFRSASDEDLDRYLQFLSSDIGKWFIQVDRSAWAAAITESAAYLQKYADPTLDEIKQQTQRPKVGAQP